MLALTKPNKIKNGKYFLRITLPQSEHDATVFITIQEYTRKAKFNSIQDNIKLVRYLKKAQH